MNKQIFFVLSILFCSAFSLEMKIFKKDAAQKFNFVKSEQINRRIDDLIIRTSNRKLKVSKLKQASGIGVSPFANTDLVDTAATGFLGVATGFALGL